MPDTLSPSVVDPLLPRTLLDVIVEKSHETCFIEWCIGIGILTGAIGPIFGYHIEPLTMGGIAASLCVTRLADAIKRGVHTYTQGKYVLPAQNGNGNGNGSQTH